MKPVRFDIDKAELSLVPKAPGVYIFRDISENVLYVGKARDLRRRLSSYLSDKTSHVGKVALMLSRASTFEYILTSSEKEALILEAVLIKEHRPRFNIRLRDDKTYPYLCLDIDHSFPGIRFVRKRTGKGILFGPYPSADAARQTMRFIAATFGIRTCKGSHLRPRKRPCLRYQMGLCLGPCVGKVTEKQYMLQVEKARMFLEGRSRGLLAQLKREMDQAASDLAFERAALIRDRIRAIERVLEAQCIVSQESESWDVIACEMQQGRAFVCHMQLRDGKIVSQAVHRLDTILEKTKEKGILSVFIRQYYLDAPVPAKLLVSNLPEDLLLIENWLSEKAGRKVRIILPKKGIKAKVLSMAIENAHQALESIKTQEEDWRSISQGLKELLKLVDTPDEVEGVDISTTQGMFTVGSIVSFLKGKPQKGLYRHYNLTGDGHPDDYQMIYQVVSKRLKRGLVAGDLPDIILIDGGQGQLSMACKALSEAGLTGKVALCSIAKQRGEKKDSDACGGERIYVPGKEKPLILPRHDPILLFLQQVRDEAHRFGIQFHRKKRQKFALRARLLEIPGVGPRRQQALLKHFGSLRCLKEASVEEISKVKGISADLAQKIRAYLTDEGRP